MPSQCLHSILIARDFNRGKKLMLTCQKYSVVENNKSKVLRKPIKNSANHDDTTTIRREQKIGRESCDRMIFGMNMTLLLVR